MHQHSHVGFGAQHNHLFFWALSTHTRENASDDLFIALGHEFICDLRAKESPAAARRSGYCMRAWISLAFTSRPTTRADPPSRESPSFSFSFVLLGLAVLRMRRDELQVMLDRPKELADSPIKGPVTPEDEERMRVLLPIHLAPKYLQHNPFILHGYRGYLTTKLCIESIFWWTNETINIWSHIFGFVLFCGLTFYDLYIVNITAPFGDRVLCCLLLICFQACMILSSIYHTFSCRSEKDYFYFLSYDLLGVALSLLSIYMSGVYYAFWCHKQLQRFYLITVLAIFILAMMVQLPRYNVNDNVRLAVFVGWAIYGVIPTLHWIIAMGGMENPMVALLVPRVLGMYCISGAAFFIYFSKIPERLCPGWVDYVGSSHQWWHILVVAALYYWHNTGMMYVEYRLNNGCVGLSQL